ncbi:MAG: adenylyl-sulfate kinase [archaeon GB-1867-035]|nr:adenylyl-sulfate kinase [Candidatus Culexmicrobium profundum]
MNKGFVVWITGLPGSGKTTIARGVAEKLRQKGLKVELLDGDEVRRWLSPEAGFTREDRTRHLIRVAHVAKLLARNGVIVIASFVSPYRDVRRKAREIVEGEGIPFIEVYVECSLEECIRRDPKGLYKRALRGEIKHMTGIDDPYESPENPEVKVNTEKYSANENIRRVMREIEKII